MRSLILVPSLTGVLVLSVWLVFFSNTASADCIPTGPGSSCHAVAGAMSNPVQTAPLAPATRSGCTMAQSGDVFCLQPDGTYQKADCEQEASGTDVLCKQQNGSYAKLPLANGAQAANTNWAPAPQPTYYQAPPAIAYVPVPMPVYGYRPYYGSRLIIRLKFGS